MKSPLRYPGGKSKAAKTIRSFMPARMTEMASPFLGGGSVELACAEAGTRVWGADAFEPVVNFWTEALRDPEELARRAWERNPVSRDKFHDLYAEYFTLTDPMERASAFWTLNRTSFSGLTLNRAGYSSGDLNFNARVVERMRKFRAPNLSVKLARWQETLAEHPDKFLYLDPPYPGVESIYGFKGRTPLHEAFDHEELARAVRGRENWVLSYPDCALARDLYAGYAVIDLRWTYGMQRRKRKPPSREILILSDPALGGLQF